MGKQTEEKGYYVFVMDSKVIIGDLYFSYNPELDFGFEKGFEIWYEHMLKGETEKYEEFAKDAMARHYQFYGELDNEEYVTRDSVLSCIYGTHSRRLDLLVDHGVKAPNGQFVATCKDCREGVNIHDFGICRCPVPADLPEREKIELIVSLDEVGRPYRETGQKCMPVFMEGWQQVRERTMIYVKDGETFEVTLTNKAIMVCKYGGWITIDEVPEATVEPEEFFIAPWLVGYRGKPTAGGGKSVTYSFEDRQKVKEEVKPDSFDWYSYEGWSGKNPWCEKYLEGQEFINTKYGEGELTDSNGRYWVTLGPKVFIYDYPDNGKCEADEFGEYIGCRVDVVLYNTKDQTYAYIECVFSGNIKAHTFDNGVYQAGYPYEESAIAKNEPYSKDYVDGSIVEFTGKKPSSNGTMSEYIVKELLVYPK